MYILWLSVPTTADLARHKVFHKAFKSHEGAIFDHAIL